MLSRFLNSRLPLSSLGLDPRRTGLLLLRARQGLLERHVRLPLLLERHVLGLLRERMLLLLLKLLVVRVHHHPSLVVIHDVVVAKWVILQRRCIAL